MGQERLSGLGRELAELLRDRQLRTERGRVEDAAPEARSDELQSTWHASRRVAYA
jgi:hypothetical protein